MLKINFKKISNHLKRLQIILLTANNRPGSSLLHCILDGHKEICTLPLFYNYSWDMFTKIKNRDLNTIIDRFVFLNPALFNSGLNETKNLHKLGKKGNENIIISITKFKKKFIKLSKYFTKSKKNFFLLVHAAIYLTIRRDILKCKVIVYQIHSLSVMKNINFLFNYKTVHLHITREPKAGLFREIENPNQKNKDIWDIDRKEIFSLKNYNDPSRITDLIKDNLILDLDYVSKTFLLTFEQLHTGKKKYIFQILEKFSLSTKNFKIKPTYYNKIYWSDARSIQKFYLFRDDFELYEYENKLSYLDQIVIDYFAYKKTRRVYQKYNLIKNNFIFFVLSVFIMPILIFKPFRYEINAFFYAFKNLEIFSMFTCFYCYYSKTKHVIKHFKNIIFNKITYPVLLTDKYIPVAKNN